MNFLLIMLIIIGVAVFLDIVLILGIVLIGGKYWYKSKFDIVHLSNGKYAIKAGIGSGFYGKNGDNWTIPRFVNKYCIYDTYEEAVKGVEKLKKIHLI